VKPRHELGLYVIKPKTFAASQPIAIAFEGFGVIRRPSGEACVTNVRQAALGILKRRCGLRERGAHGLSSGEVAEWLMAADCKSALERVHRFKSYPHHHDSFALPRGERPGARRSGNRMRV
jgi:hypothetical protein